MRKNIDLLLLFLFVLLVVFSCAPRKPQIPAAIEEDRIASGEIKKNEPWQVEVMRSPGRRNNHDFH